MLHLLLHRGRPLRAVSGCIVDRIPSTGNRFFVKWFSSTILCCDAFAKEDWREVFEGIFESPFLTAKLLPKKQSAGSAPFLFSESRNTIYNKGGVQGALKEFFTEKKFQPSEDDKLLHIFRHLNVDDAIVLCAKLPANHLKTGIDTLIKVCLEGAYEVTYRQELVDKIFELLKLSNYKGYTPSEVTSQSLVKWLLDNGDASKAQNIQQLLHNRQHSDVPKDFEFSETMELAEIECIEDKMSRDRRKESDNVIGTSVPGMPKANLSKLMDFYVQGFTKNPRDIKRDFEGSAEMNELLKLRTNISFNRMIAHCANHGEIGRCINLIQTMKSIGLQPCAASYEPLIAFFAGTLEISKAEDILQMMRNNGMHASKKAYECLILSYTKSDNLEKAFNLIEEISSEELTPELYNPIIHAYGMRGQVSLALSVFEQMSLKNVKPNAQSFASLIRACGIRKDLKSAEKAFKAFKKHVDFTEESQKLVSSAMLRVYAVCGNDEQIEKTMSFTYANNLVKNKTKSELLNDFAETGKIHKALQLYNQIRDEGKWPGPRAFHSLMFNLGEAGELDQLLALYDPFKKSLQTRNRILQENLSSIACCTIVHALIRHNQLERALGFLQKIQLDNEGDVETLCLKVFTQDKCKTRFTQHERLTLKDKLDFLSGMRDRLKVRPTRLAYESLLESCARENNVECADCILRMMKSDNLVLNVFTYLILLRIAVSSGNLKGVKSFLSNMRGAVENSGLQDVHVKLVVIEVLKSANFDTSDLMCELYPSTGISI